ncbi:MAG: Sir2 family NAD-dependent protein deacetylase [Chitinophagaceae bacterium]
MKKLVVFTGAGMSAESGLKTFRDSDGLWEGYDIHEVATPSAWNNNPALVLQFYNERRKNCLQAQPNVAHLMLKDLEQDFDVQIITQNIDDLHERAGSTSILHLHGEIVKMRNEHSDHRTYPIYTDMHIGDRDENGIQLRPHIVWFNEPVPMISKAIDIVRQADIFVVIGTSLVVYPAASLIDFVHAKTPIFVLDKKIPAIQQEIVAIEKTAVEGSSMLRELLLKLK